jgi:Fe-S-cluster containining protein
MHPCQSCGACCASYRVGFYRGEALEGEAGAVPDELVEPISAFRVAMRGTAHEPLRCVALDGVIGGACGCRIYALRPTPCREFQASWEDGVHQPRCDEARARHGLAPLNPADFAVDG